MYIFFIQSFEQTIGTLTNNYQAICKYTLNLYMFIQNVINSMKNNNSHNNTSKQIQNVYMFNQNLIKSMKIIKPIKYIYENIYKMYSCSFKM